MRELQLPEGAYLATQPVQGGAGLGTESAPGSQHLPVPVLLTWTGGQIACPLRASVSPPELPGQEGSAAS